MATVPGRTVVLIVLGVSALLGGAVMYLLRPSAGISSIAVLPFAGGDDASDGITQGVIAALGSEPGLRVPPWTAVAAYKNKPHDLRDIGTRLNVDAGLEGSVERQGGRLRINARLNKAVDGFRVWSGTYDIDPADAPRTERDIARAIARQLGR